MEHCHNTVHEDHAMLIRWELDKGAVPMQTPNPTPQGVTYINTTVLPTAFNSAPAPTGGSGLNGGGGKGGNGGGKGGSGGGSGSGKGGNGADDAGSGSGRGGNGGGSSSGKGGSGRGKNGR
jgi:manganese oxidase